MELEHLKIETRLIDEKFANAMGEYVTVGRLRGDRCPVQVKINT